VNYQRMVVLGHGDAAGRRLRLFEHLCPGAAPQHDGEGGDSASVSAVSPSGRLRAGDSEVRRPSALQSGDFR